MNVSFNAEFKKVLSELGNTIKLSHFRLENGDETSDYLPLKSILLKDTKKLSLTLDCSSIDKNSFKSIKTIQFYYSDINNNLNHTAAFTISDNDNDIYIDKEKPCFIVVPINFEINSNLICEHPEVDFLEEDSGVVGVNVLNSKEYDENSYITKDSLFRSIRHKNSELNDNPTFYNKVGKRISDIIYYREYKHINIKILDIFGKDNRYFIEDGSTFCIDGFCNYDLYKIENNTKYLIEENCNEDLSNIELIYLDENNIEKPFPKYLSVNQFNKEISFNDKQNKKINFKICGRINFIDSVTKEHKTIKSNIINITTFVNWFVEFSSNYSQKDLIGDSHTLILFDIEADNNGWGDKSSGNINIYFDENIDEKNIKVIKKDTGLDINSSKEYFKYDSIIKTKYINDDNLPKYRYTIPLKTTKENKSNHWFPRELELFAITNNNIIIAEFYCVQRCISKLRLNKVVTIGKVSKLEQINQITFESDFGVNEINDLYIKADSDGEEIEYKYWNLKFKEDNNFFICSDNNRIYEPDQNIKPFSILTKYVTGYGEDTEGEYLGEFTIERLNKNQTNLINNWKDEIYCSPDNNLTVKVYKKFRVNSSIRIYSDTPYYFYNSEQDYKRLYIFDSNDPKPQHFIVELVSRSPTENVNIVCNNIDLTPYYDIIIGNLSNNGDNYKRRSVTITPNKNNLYGNYNRPLRGRIYLAKRDSDSGSYGTLLEEFYCINKPDLSGSMKFLDKDNNEISQILFTEKENSKKLRLVDVNNKINEFKFWGVSSIDPSIKLDSFVDTGLRSINDMTDNLCLINTQPSQTTIDESRNPFIVRRLNNRYFDIRSILYDWRNQLVEDDFTVLDIKVEGKKPSENINIYTIDEGNRVYLEDEDFLNLDYIGLYRVFIESNNKFKISLSTTNKSEGLYFYNPETNEILQDINSIEEYAFNDITGKEFFIAFLGGELNNFETDKKIFDTHLTVLNLLDNTSKVIKFSREYPSPSFYPDITDLANPNDITRVDNNIILKNKQTNYSIKYTSKLETLVESSKTTSSTKTFFNEKSNLNDRGYVKTERNFDVTNVTEIGSFPLYPKDHIKIYHKNNPDDNYLSYNIYRLPRIYNTSVNSKEIGLPSYSGSEAILTVRIQPEYNHVFEVEDNKGKRIEIDKTGTTICLENKVVITSFRDKNSYVVKFKDNTNSVASSSENELLGKFRIITNILSNNFIRDDKGNEIPVRQGLIDTQYVVIDPIDINIKRLSANNTKSEISGEKSLISPLGETVNFTVNCSGSLGPNPTLDLNAHLDEMSEYVNSITPTNGLNFKVQYKSLIERLDYRNLYENNEAGIEVKIHNENYITKLDGEIIEKLKSLLVIRDSNIKIDINYGNSIKETISSIESKAINQNNIKECLRIVERDITIGGSGGGRIYVGDYGETIREVHLNTNDRETVNFTVSPVFIENLFNNRNFKDVYDPSKINITCSTDANPETITYIKDEIQGFTFGSVFKCKINKNTGVAECEVSRVTISYGITKITFVVYAPPSSKRVYVLDRDNLGSPIDTDNLGNDIFENSLNNRVKDLIFSASGKLIYPRTLVLAIESNNPDQRPEDNIPRGIKTDFSITNFLIPDGQEDYTAQSFSIPNYLTPRFETTQTRNSINTMYFTDNRSMGKIIDNNRGKQRIYFLYKVSVNSKITSVISSKTLITPEDYFWNYLTEGELNISIPELITNTIRLNTHYGYSKLTLRGPYESVIKTTVRSKPIMGGGISYSYDLDDIINGYLKIEQPEEEKHRDSFTTSNTSYGINTTYNKIIYRLDNSLLINYIDSSISDKSKFKKKITYPDGSETNTWDLFGYYSGFKLIFDRIEFFKDKSTGYIHFQRPKYIEFKIDDTFHNSSFTKLNLVGEMVAKCLFIQQDHLSSTYTMCDYKKYISPNGTDQTLTKFNDPTVLGTIKADGSMLLPSQVDLPESAVTLHFYYKDDSTSTLSKENDNTYTSALHIFVGKSNSDIDNTLPTYGTDVEQPDLDKDPISYEIKIRLVI